MKYITQSVMAMVLVILLFYPLNASAGDFWDNINYGIESTSAPGILAVDARLYNGRFTGQWNDVNNNQNLDAGEILTTPVTLYNRYGRIVLESPGTVTNRDELADWAAANAEIIFNTIFGGSPSFAAGVSDDMALGQASLSNTVFEKTIPRKKQLAMDQINDDFKAPLEYISLDVNGVSGDAFSVVLGYAHDFGNKLEFGFYLPYRYTTMSDEIDTDAHYIGLFMYAKKPVITWQEINLTWSIGGDVFGSAFYAQSDAISDMGNLKYGVGVFTSLTKIWSSCLVSLGLDYKISDASLPSSWIDSDDEFIQEAIDWVNDLDPVGAVSYGFNIGIPVLNDAAAINFEAIRTHFISDDIDDERDVQSSLEISCAYYPTDTFEIRLGLRGTFELDDMDVYGITIGSIYKF